MEVLRMKRASQAVSFFGWLVLACLLLLLSGGDKPVELAVWLGPAILLGFVRKTRPWVGLPLSLVRLAGSGAEIVLWSEGAMVALDADEESYIDRASTVAKEHGIHLGISICVLEGAAQGRGEPFIANKLILISPDGTVGWEYLKSNLAPGMERRWSIRGDGMLRAHVSAKAKITGAICYDMDFPAHIRQAGSMSADLLLAPANDWPEIKETHWQMSRMRAIENGISILRPSSKGVSTAVDQFGRVVSGVDYLQSGGSPLSAVLPVGSVGTVYARIGDSWVWAFIVGEAFMIVLSAIRWRSERRISVAAE
jgi:apolipoprotein N-acyltransferase